MNVKLGRVRATIVATEKQ